MAVAIMSRCGRRAAVFLPRKKARRTEARTYVLNALASAAEVDPSALSVQAAVISTVFTGFSTLNGDLTVKSDELKVDQKASLQALARVFCSPVPDTSVVAGLGYVQTSLDATTKVKTSGSLGVDSDKQKFSQDESLAPSMTPGASRCIFRRTSQRD